MPVYHLFKSKVGNQRAVSDDRSAEKLPSGPAAWSFEKDVSIEHDGGPLIGAESDDIISDVERVGYHLWPKSKLL